MTSLEAATTLKELLTSALYYARQSQAGRNADPLHDSSTALWVRQFNELDFEPPGVGYDVLNGTTSWKEWARRFQSAVEDLIAYRETFGFEGHEVKVVDSGVTTSGGGFWIGSRTDDPLQSWWIDIAAPRLENLAITDGIQWVTEPLREGADALTGVLAPLGPVVAIIIVILVLILAVGIAV